MPTSSRPVMLTLREINRATLARQMLLARERVSPLAAIERLVALQAQWPRPPYVGLWTRLREFDRPALNDLFLTRKIVRATFLRATIHVVSTRDFLAFRPALQPALDASMHAILKKRLESIDVATLARRAERILAGRPHTFEELRERFRHEDPGADERAMAYVVRMLLPLVQVPSNDDAWGFPSRARFAPAAQWLARKVATKPAPPDALLLRYLAAYGPATPRDFQAWAGLAPDVVRDAFTRLRTRLQRFEDEQGRDVVDLPDAPRPGADAPAPVRFVPEYDNLITTRADERFVKRANRPRVFLPGLRIAATVLIDGFVAGTWTVQVVRKIATIAIEPFAPLTRRVKGELEEEAEALARFMEPQAKAVGVSFAR